MSRNAHFGESFGMSRQEQDRISGQALGAHIWDKVMEPWGGESGFKNALHSDAYDRIRQSGYDTEHIKFDEHDDGAPYVEHSVGPYRARWHGGTYADIHHVSDPESAVDTLNVGHESSPDKDIPSQLQTWHDEVARHYR